MHFAVLTAKFAPQNCGVGEQTALLLEELRARHGLEGEVLVASPQWQAEKAPPFPVSRPWTGDPPADARAMLLQYSGYGYAKRGASLGLVMQMRQVRRRHPGLRLVTMFHELFAFGPPTSSSFWLSPFQRWVAMSVARLSDRVITNRTASAQWLEKHAPGHRGQVRVSPVFSNLGEVTDALPPSQREAHLVFFGYQAELWDAGFGGLRSVIEKLRPSRVTILGRSAEIPADVFGCVTVTRTGWLSAEKVSAILRTARWGLVAYNPAFLGKSSLLAAFMAHGVAPLLVEGHLPLSEGLQRGVHLAAVQDLGGAPPGVDAISMAGSQWYRPHNLSNTAAMFYQLLKLA